MAAEKQRLVLVCGSDTPVGRAVVRRLSTDSKIICSTRRSGECSTDVVAFQSHVERLCPDVIVNCLLDVDDGGEPQAIVNTHIAPSHALLQCARTLGSRLIYCSTSAVFGTSHPTESRMYAESDPWIIGEAGHVWQPLAQSLETQQLMLLSPFNFQCKYETHVNFEFYCLRLGQLLFPQADRANLGLDWTLSTVIAEAVDSESLRLLVGNRNAWITPIDTVSVANAIAQLCETRPRAVSGLYHVASSDAVTVSQFLNYISNQLSCVISVNDLDYAASGAEKWQEVTQLDTDTALATDFWLSRYPNSLPTWKAALNNAIELTLVG